ncbi:MAG: ATP-binding protein [Promethearchaeota archaeon]
MRFSKSKFLREVELETLERMFASDGAELAIVYGRRRLGKTTLLVELLHGKRGAYLYTPRGSLPEILSTYTSSLKTQLGLHTMGKLDSFVRFLEVLGAVAKDEKVLVVVDEFQRINEANRPAISHLQDHWDRHLKDTGIKLVLVGSAIGTIQKLALSGDAPLHGRRTMELKVRPLPYHRTREFWGDLTPEERVLAYGVFGGTPAYLDLYEFGTGVWDNVRNLIVEKTSPLNNEPEELLAAEMRKSTTYLSVLEQISRGVRGLPLSKIRSGSKNVMPYIHALETIDLVERVYPVGSTRRGTLYAIRDEFFRFWFKFIRPNYWMVEMGRTDLLMDQIRDGMGTHLSFTFEKILRELMALYSGKSLLGVDLPKFRKFGSYWEGQLEVDGLGVGDDTVVTGEAKWRSKPAGLKEVGASLDAARSVAEKFRKKRAIVLFLSKAGFKREYDEPGLVLLDLESLERAFDDAAERQETHV